MTGAEGRFDELRYPLGHFRAPDVVSPEHMESWIDEIDRFPTIFREVIQALTPMLPDYSEVPVLISLQLLEALHGRWVGLLHGLGPAFRTLNGRS